MVNIRLAPAMALRIFVRQQRFTSMPRPSSLEPACFVYVLASLESAPRTYVGWTTDLDRRLAQHNKGLGAKTTRGRQWWLIYAEKYHAPSEALRREYRLKRDRNFRAYLRTAATPSL
jgi:putative endonuclease